MWLFTQPESQHVIRLWLFGTVTDQSCWGWRAKCFPFCTITGSLKWCPSPPPVLLILFRFDSRFLGSVVAVRVWHWAAELAWLQVDDNATLMGVACEASVQTGGVLHLLGASRTTHATRACVWGRCPKRLSIAVQAQLVASADLGEVYCWRYDGLKG